MKLFYFRQEARETTKTGLCVCRDHDHYCVREHCYFTRDWSCDWSVEVQRLCSQFTVCLSSAVTLEERSPLQCTNEGGYTHGSWSVCAFVPPPPQKSVTERKSVSGNNWQQLLCCFICKFCINEFHLSSILSSLYTNTPHTRVKSSSKWLWRPRRSRCLPLIRGKVELDEVSVHRLPL